MDTATGEVTPTGYEGGAPAPPEGTNVEAQRLEADIAQTRADIGSTIQALQEKLNPAHIAEQAKAAVREATLGKVETMVHNAEEQVNHAGRSLLDTLRANPIPAALVGLGVAWLYMSNRRAARFEAAPRYARFQGRGRFGDRDRFEDRGFDEERGLVERAGDVAHTVGEKAEHAASEVAHKAQDVAHRAGELADRAGTNIKETTREASQAAGRFARSAYHEGVRLENRVEDAFHTNPLAVGAVALAAGTAVGLAIPISRKEEEWMGEARDRMVGRVGEMAKEALEKVQDVAGTVQEVAGKAQEVAGKAQQNVARAT